MFRKAITGYNFCLDALKKNYNDDESKNEDVLLIWQTTYDWLAKLLFSLSKYKDARDCLSEALNISLKLNGEEHETTALLLNDLGTAMFFLGQEIQAFEHLTKAAEIGKFTLFLDDKESRCYLIFQYLFSHSKKVTSTCGMRANRFCQLG